MKLFPSVPKELFIIRLKPEFDKTRKATAWAIAVFRSWCSGITSYWN